MKKEGNQNCSIKGILKKLLEKKITGIVLNLGCTAIWWSFSKLRGDQTHPESKGKNRKREKAEANSYCIVLELTELSSTQFRIFSGNIGEAVWSIVLVSGGYYVIYHWFSTASAVVKPQALTPGCQNLNPNLGPGRPWESYLIPLDPRFHI